MRCFLQIPPATNAVLERYSDSAATFVVLDPNNVSVYKQLFRAAKAKQKLKLRVTTTKAEQPEAEQGPREAGGPKPVTVEDEPEAPVAEKQKEPDTTVEPTAPQPTSQYSTPAPASTEAPASDTIVAPQDARDFPDFIKQWRARGMPRIHLRRNDSGVEVIDFRGPATPADPMVTLEPLPEGSSVLLDKTLSSDRHQYRFSQTASTLSFTDLIQQAQTADANGEAKTEDKEVEVPKSTPAALPTPDSMPASSQESLLKSGRLRPFTVCCNSCDKAIPNAHYHCSSCDDGDFDLCVDCVDRGITCYDDGHWLIKRTIENGLICYSTTQVAPRSSRSPASGEKKPEAESAPIPAPCSSLAGWSRKVAMKPAEKVSSWDTGFARTCNSCVQEYPESDFLHCNSCEDYDLCQTCFTHDQHGHHPSHSFSPAVKGTVFSQSVSSRLPAGRNVPHNAICDGCDKYIHGVRHKCLECPDWDYCSECVENASFIHPGHRFVALFEPIGERICVSRAVHSGICCDGPLCKSNSKPRYIVGERYKCAVCNDLDFCANCEASPANLHNKTHPLIKFQTPVRHVFVTTTGEHVDGQSLPTMGDRSTERTGEKTAPHHRLNDQILQRNRELRRQLLARARHMASEASLSSRSGPKEEPAANSLDGIAVNTMRTVVDVEPTEPQEVKVEEAAVEADQVTLVEEKEPEKEPVPDLVAIFKHDTVEDGTIMPPNHTFEQTWVLRNEGSVPWPAGCTVKFVGGDYMGAVDPTHPAGIHELVSASESTVCYNQLKPGQEFPFTVLMRTPEREGKVISYWRLTTADGVKFGHKLWCDVTVQAPPPKALEETIVDTQVPETVKSQMIIPKLDHESPASSLHVSQSKEEAEMDKTAGHYAPSVDGNEDDFEDCGEDESWAEQSDDGFMTDEEYDILDASDEEYLFEQQKGAAKK